MCVLSLTGALRSIDLVLLSTLSSIYIPLKPLLIKTILYHPITLVVVFLNFQTDPLRPSGRSKGGCP